MKTNFQPYFTDSLRWILESGWSFWYETYLGPESMHLVRPDGVIYDCPFIFGRLRYEYCYSRRSDDSPVRIMDVCTYEELVAVCAYVGRDLPKVYDHWHKPRSTDLSYHVKLYGDIIFDCKELSFVEALRRARRNVMYDAHFSVAVVYRDSGCRYVITRDSPGFWCLKGDICF